MNRRKIKNPVEQIDVVKFYTASCLILTVVFLFLGFLLYEGIL